MRMRLFVLFSVLLVCASAAEAQIIHPTSGTSNQTVTSGQSFRDSGDTVGNYSNDESGVTVLCPSDPDLFVSLAVNSFAVEEQLNNGCYDWITFYNGDSTADPVIHSGCGDYDDNCANNAAVCIQAGDVFTSTSADGCLTVEFTSDDVMTYEGWEMTVSLVEARAGIPTLGPSGIALLVLVMAGAALLVIRRRLA